MRPLHSRKASGRGHACSTRVERWARMREGRPGRSHLVARPLLLLLALAAACEGAGEARAPAAAPWVEVTKPCPAGCTLRGNCNAGERSLEGGRPACWVGRSHLFIRGTMPGSTLALLVLPPNDTGAPWLVCGCLLTSRAEEGRCDCNFGYEGTVPAGGSRGVGGLTDRACMAFVAVSPGCVAAGTAV